ncbi:GDSL-type esterase/lipase family protein [Ideonella azotifigens]|uniref:SGNH/GDSL hydrolase family protein n=2 Tax=Ideonella azotifigens TaxID=513160 RepID=A0ABP3VR66_9BURK|nr:SGNH/GDSL hydrolase family protein [Ideonella azotifigens]MCD2344199.1 GDSL-type esterase/lipase family protein [Ideonella azotifigens]
MRKSLRTAATVAGLSMVALGAARAQSLTTPLRSPNSARSEIDARWRESLDAFAAADRTAAPQPGGVLFVGSSSIRLWGNLETQFDQQPSVIKRGFGGSRLSDVARYLDRLVLPYQPRLVVVYAGDNDLAEGATPQDVLKSFQTLVEGVKAALPDTRIAYLSIKPSPLRASLMPSIHDTNALIAAYADKTANLDFIDIYSKMLDSQGQPRPELFLEDRLHMNEQGYALWRKEIASHLLPRQAPQAVQTAAR